MGAAPWGLTYLHARDSVAAKLRLLSALQEFDPVASLR